MARPTQEDKVREKERRIRRLTFKGFAFQDLPEADVAAIRAFLRLETDEVPLGKERLYHLIESQIGKSGWPLPG